jgi:GNAT superfamily N-acetyltransferase
VRIRAVRTEDLRVLQEIERAAGLCFAEIGMTEVAEDPPPPIEELAKHQAAGLAWVAVDAQGVPAAYLVAALVDGQLHVEQVSVHPRAARRGVGRRLLERAVEEAKARGLAAVTLTTFADVPWNAPYYRRCGFRVLDESELTPELRAMWQREAALFPRWPRVCMRRDL